MTAAEQLKKEGFGVLTEIDFSGTMKKKLDKDIPNYRILGACNPGFAHKALTNDLYIGLLLPCNVTVFEDDDGAVNVSIVKPTKMFEIVGRDELAPISAEVESMLKGTLEDLQKAGGSKE